MQSETNKILVTKPGKDYELIDSGNGEKLERFGEFVLRRPDPQALWNKKLSTEKWDTAHARYVPSGRSGSWKKTTEIPEDWQIEMVGLKFGVSLSAFKHTGIFPEQAENWNWIKETLGKANRPVTVLNLFGYTGGATLAAASAGASVCHVDGSKVSVNRASENAKLSGLDSQPIRWIVDDIMAFVKREVRRGNTYDGIIMDPPSYGHGPDKEIWKIEEHLPELIAECKKLLSSRPLFVLINGYAAGFSAIAYKNNLLDMIDSRPGSVEFGELALEAKLGGLLPAGIFARWHSEV